MEKEQVSREKKRIRHVKMRYWITKILQVLLASGCIYMVFLIYGLLVTQYEYDEAGNVVPLIETTQEIHDRNIFHEVLSYYLRARTLYENVLRLDYRLSEKLEEPKLLSPEYEGMLDDISKLSIDLEALTVETRYSQVKTMLLEWTKNDIAVYLQNMATALSQNNQEKAENAIVDRDRMYSDFKIITENIAVLGQDISGADIANLYNWSPERFVQETLEGIPYE